MATGSASEEPFDVFVSHAVRDESDHAAVRGLVETLRDHGVVPWVAYERLEADDEQAGTLRAALATAPVFLACVGRGELGTWGQEELELAAGRAEAGDGVLLVTALLTGARSRDLPSLLPRAFLATAPFDLRDGPETADRLATYIRTRGAAAEPPPLPSKTSFSTSARRALTHAAAMLDEGQVDAARLRSAGLLGALLESARHDATPSTGDVVRLIMGRQEERDPEATLAGVCGAADLAFPRANDARTVTALRRSPARPLVTEAEEVARRTSSARVHLRHVLATGVSDAVPRAVLDELGVTLPELRAAWRESLARTWPDEPGWADVVRDPPDELPPSARVHTDRWTVEDRLDYGLYAKAIAEFLQHRQAQPPAVISVQAPWGQGKTSLMRMVQQQLDPRHPDLPQTPGAAPAQYDTPKRLSFGDLRRWLDGSLPEPASKPIEVRTVWFNAWKYGSSEQIWAGLAHTILAQLPARLTARERELFWLRLQLRRIDPSAVRADIHRAALERFLPRLAGWIVAVFATIVVVGLALLAGDREVLGVAVGGIGAGGALAYARYAWSKATDEVLARPLEGAYQRYVEQPDYAGKLGYLHLVEEDMGRALDLLAPAGKPVVIFIDDLDRCSPGKIAEVIEAVNLFLAGEYPNCAFVIGIDAEVVAASMEVVHAGIIAKLGDRRGELGWRFMDKFIQLPFVVPRLHRDQREAFLRGLFATPVDAAAAALVAEAKALETEVRGSKQPVDQLADRVAALAPRLAVVAPEQARTLGEELVSAGARAFSDDDDDVVQAIADQLRYLSDNPRTIKRAVNLYRFHRFTAFARKASAVPLPVATPAQIGRWIVVIVRWPSFVRWLQATRDDALETTSDPATAILAVGRKAGGPRAFQAALHEAGISAGWTDDFELLEFLQARTSAELELDLASARGLW